MGSRPTQADIAAYNAWARRNNEEPYGAGRAARPAPNPDGPKEQILEELRALAKDRNIRDARKLYQMAKAQDMRDVTQALAKEALQSSVARQVLAPPPRSAGHFASSRPGQDVQADLIDFSKNTKLKGQPHRYAVVVADVFTRKLGIEPVKNKSSATVGAAMQRELKEMGLDGAHKPALIRTDKGKEFASLDNEHNIHQTRDVRDTSGLAIVDKGIQSIKRDLAAEVGKKKGTKWADVAEKVVRDHNEKPNSAVFGPPDSVEKNPVQQFKVLQQNADYYAQNAKSTERMKAAIEKAGYFREPIDNGGRSFKPKYGPAQEVERVDSDYVHAKGYRRALETGKNEDDYNTLLKQAIPATKGQFQEKLTLDTDLVQKQTAKAALKPQATTLENLLLKEGSVATEDLFKKVPGLQRKVRKYRNLTNTNWLEKAYKDKFEIQDGRIRLRGSAPAHPAPAPQPLPAPQPAQQSPPVQPSLPAGYSAPALVFRGAVEVPKRTREQQREDKRRAEEEKEQKRQEKRMAWAEKAHQKLIQKNERLLKRLQRG